MRRREATNWKRPSDRAEEPSSSAEKEAQLQTWKGEAATTALTRPVRILLVDNDMDEVDSVELMLHASGYSETRVAYSGRAALAIAAEFQPDVVLLDLGLLDRTGYELAQSLREQAQSRRLRLIALTFSREHTAREQARAAGFERYLLKPVTSVELSELMALPYQ